MSPNDSVDDPYAVLGVTAAASPDELRRAYRQRMRSVHPDTKNGDEEAAKQVNAAYTLLSDPARRRIYDRTRSAQAAERSGAPAM
ncbi:J domain-containing protein [Candidatus Poriferisodalis sp.]|uniref:J domain-containing protein n=1 Tax=Candidatus Poriferisodalis sp. TaxID=3101277 RepID=UPI003D121D3A